MKGADIEYMDDKVFQCNLDIIKLSGLYIHIMFVQGLYEVKSKKSGVTMYHLLRFAKETSFFGYFVDWAEIYTPYSYSNKKKRMVRDNTGKWRLTQAFSNPNINITSSEFLNEQIERFCKLSGNASKEPIDLEAFQKYLESRMDELEIIIERRKARNKLKSEACHENNKKIFESLNEEEKNMINEYLSRYPSPETIGPMGTPQSKYRYGTFGLKSMVYDAWRRS